MKIRLKPPSSYTLPFLDKKIDILQVIGKRTLDETGKRLLFQQFLLSLGNLDLLKSRINIKPNEWASKTNQWFKQEKNLGW
jgi:hypothetical protein